ncbi:MAG: hypothetical protein PHO63_01385 [Bacilli bacterium]|nr:hypothetical protein [Bacilli bacterium]MDD4808820.1 hypothetical protein [Bacilli bacterium]
MKKGLVILLVILSFLLIGCVKDNLDKEEKYLKEYATDYYNKFMTSKLDSYEITISMLEESNKTDQTDYDLSKLKSCKNDSYVTITIENEEKIYDFKLNCKS